MVRYNFKKITVVPNGKDFIDITEKKKTERDLEANDEWKEDVMPEILDGHNRYDFIDPDILQRLEELRREESTDTDSDLDDCEIDGEELKPEEKDFVTAVRRNMIIRVPMKFDMDKKFTSERMGRQLSDLGLDRARSKSRGRKRERSPEKKRGDSMDVDMDTLRKKLRMKSRSLSVARSMPPTEAVPGDGFRDSAMKVKARNLGKKSIKKRNKEARRGEADRVIPTRRPKHLFSGKRSTGKTHRR